MRPAHARPKRRRPLRCPATMSLFSAPNPIVLSAFVRRLILLVAGPVLAAVVHAADPRPNIVLVMVDDMGFSDLGCYGGEIYTPNLDRLARGGVRFQQFYDASKCAQTCASLLSGRYYAEVAFAGPQRNSVTLAEVLHEAGYTTLLSGKWHLRGDPTEHGFQRTFGHLSG